MHNDDDIQQVEIHIEHAKKIVAFGDAINRLAANKDFQTVIDEGYMTRESRRLTLLLGDENLTEQQRDHVVISLRAIGELNTYFRARLAEAEEMRKAIAEGEEMLVELQGDDAQEGDA